MALARDLRDAYAALTRHLHGSYAVLYTVLTRHLHGTYKMLTQNLQGTYKTFTRYLHDTYTALTRGVVGVRGQRVGIWVDADGDGCAARVARACTTVRPGERAAYLYATYVPHVPHSELTP